MRAYVRVHSFVYLGGGAAACEKCHICRHRQPFVLNSRKSGWNQIKSLILSVFPCSLLHSTRPDCDTLFCLLRLSASLEPQIYLVGFFLSQYIWTGDASCCHLFVSISCARTCSQNSFHILLSPPSTRNKSISSSSLIFFLA